MMSSSFFRPEDVARLESLMILVRQGVASP
ncbi:hypothetical protein X759_11065 [Mesorhizobium sp. LSHC420B00]|nr:hypothetical protein X759_11065 [Mesorhizobium sp. LSHC420B00]